MFDWVTISKYVGVAVTLILAGFGAPIPEEIPIVTAGAMVGHDANDVRVDQAHGALGGGPAYYLAPPNGPVTKWWIMLPLCIAAVVASDCVIFLAGRFGGDRLLKSSWVQRRILPAESRAKIETNFHKYGIMILLGARLTPGIRTPVFLMAGILKMPVRRFLLADMLYAIPGVNLLFWLSYWFTDQFVEAIHAVERHRPMIVVAVLSAVIGLLLYKFATSRKYSTGDMAEIPALVKPVGAVTQAVEQTIEKGVAKTIKTTAAVVEKVTHPHGRAPKPEPAAPTTPQVPG